MSCTIDTTATANEIRCEMVLNASVSRVWEALTSVDGWTAWFSEDIDTDFQIGSRMRLDFGKYGVCWGVVTERKEELVFAYRWHPGEDCDFDKYAQEEMTDVRFELTGEGTKTRLVLTESGFERIPESRRLSALRSNTEGWTSELQKLVTFANEGTIQTPSNFTIRRERNYQASLEKLWTAAATPTGWEQWFCKSVRGPFSPGEFAFITFDKRGRDVEGPLRTETYQPTEFFSFKWHPAQTEGCKWTDFPESEATLVEFQFESAETGSRLTVVESGFENIPESRRLTSLGLNRLGWTFVVDMIGDYLAK